LIRANAKRLLYDGANRLGLVLSRHGFEIASTGVRDEFRLLESRYRRFVVSHLFRR
jgi:hypothetical protein